MRRRVLVLLAVGSATFGAGLVACIDLFHSTGDVLTACQLDAQTPGCGNEASVEAGVDAGTDFCAWSADVARRNATHACAWLGACESPLGRNAFGSCMFEALLAYDCAANHDHPVKGTTHDLWDCLWQAGSCGAVSACVFPQGPQRCGGGPFVTCATQGGVPPNADVRVECAADGAPPNGENCALWGQTCGGDLSVGVCGGSAGEPAIACTTQSCNDSTLHVCDDAGRDIGIDCASNGAQECNGFPTPTNSAWVACVPESDAGKCTPSLSTLCDGGIASSCRAGVPETLDCQTLLQNVRACHAGSLWPPYDWTSPCFVGSDDDGGDGGADDAGEAPDASACSSDSCSGMTLTGCYRGATFPLDCGAVGLGACHMVTTEQGTTMNAACAHP
jgi:hypothetical protein